MYENALFFASIALAVITSARISYVLGQRWKIYSGGEPPLFELVSMVVSGVSLWFICSAALEFAGLLGAAVVVLATIPLTGMIWILIIGGNKALERIINGLLNKLS